MPYSAITSLALPYNEDGTVVKMIDTGLGVLYTYSEANLDELNDTDLVAVDTTITTGNCTTTYLVMFFPEDRDIDALYFIGASGSGSGSYFPPKTMQGSTDTTNGLDGTWTTVTMTAGYNTGISDIDGWRKNIKYLTGCDAVKAVRFLLDATAPELNTFRYAKVLHIYGHKTSGETADDILILDALDSDAEFAADLDFGDRPSDTSTQWQIKLQNASSLTANNVTITVSDPNDIIRIADADTGPWNTSKTYTTINSGAKSAICYVKCETPAAPTPLGPQAPFLVITVGSYT